MLSTQHHPLNSLLAILNVFLHQFPHPTKGSCSWCHRNGYCRLLRAHTLLTTDSGLTYEGHKISQRHFHKFVHAHANWHAIEIAHEARLRSDTASCRYVQLATRSYSGRYVRTGLTFVMLPVILNERHISSLSFRRPVQHHWKHATLHLDCARSS